MLWLPGYIRRTPRAYDPLCDGVDEPRACFPPAGQFRSARIVAQCPALSYCYAQQIGDGLIRPQSPIHPVHIHSQIDREMQIYLMLLAYNWHRTWVLTTNFPRLRPRGRTAAVMPSLNSDPWKMSDPFRFATLSIPSLVNRKGVTAKSDRFSNSTPRKRSGRVKTHHTLLFSSTNLSERAAPFELCVPLFNIITDCHPKSAIYTIFYILCKCASAWKDCSVLILWEMHISSGLGDERRQ